MLRKSLFFALLTTALTAGCSTTTVRDTQPVRTATEQLLISTAADRAVEKLALKLLPGTKVFLETQNVDSYATDTKYVIGLVAKRLLQQGYRLMPKREVAEKIVEIRLGALSINEVKHRYLGLPSIFLPVPLAGTVGTPEINIIMKQEQKGLAKIAANVYDANDGRLQDITDAIYGVSHLTHWDVLIFSWTSSDIAPAEIEIK